MKSELFSMNITVQLPEKTLNLWPRDSCFLPMNKHESYLAIWLSLIHPLLLEHHDPDRTMNLWAFPLQPLDLSIENKGDD